MSDLHVTPGAAWRSTETVKLPSGKVAELRRPDVIDLIMGDGAIPDVLTPVILAGLTGKGTDADQIEITPENMRGLFGMLNAITRAAFVEPAIVDKPESDMGENEIGLAHVDFKDKTWILSWAMGANGDAVGRFRAQPVGSVGSVPGEQSDRPESSRDPRRDKKR